jgi:hypothetical protein
VVVNLILDRAVQGRVQAEIVLIELKISGFTAGSEPNAFDIREEDSPPRTRRTRRREREGKRD